MPAMNVTDIFIDNIYHFSRNPFSLELYTHARKCLLDYLAATIAGSKEYRTVESAFLDSPIAKGGMSSVIGHGMKSTPAMAALINGISAHAVELDDGQRFGNIHPGAPVISSLLAVGEVYGLSLEKVLRGIIVGYEATLRLACSIQPGHKLKGFHATGPCGTIGATLGIAAMMDFSKEQMKSALSAACTSASGILETDSKPFGRVSRNAMANGRRCRHRELCLQGRRRAVRRVQRRDVYSGGRSIGAPAISPALVLPIHARARFAAYFVLTIHSGVL